MTRLVRHTTANGRTSLHTSGKKRWPLLDLAARTTTNYPSPFRAIFCGK